MGAGGEGTSRSYYRYCAEGFTNPDAGELALGEQQFFFTRTGAIDVDGRVLPLHDIIKNLALTGRINQ